MPITEKRPRGKSEGEDWVEVERRREREPPQLFTLTRMEPLSLWSFQPSCQGFMPGQPPPTWHGKCTRVHRGKVKKESKQGETDEDGGEERGRRRRRKKYRRRKRKKTNARRIINYCPPPHHHCPLPLRPLHLPHLAALFEDRRLERALGVLGPLHEVFGGAPLVLAAQHVRLHKHAPVQQKAASSEQQRAGFRAQRPSCAR